MRNPLESGTDNEDPPTDLLNIIEEKFSRYEEVQKPAEAETILIQQQQLRDREQVSVIREVSVVQMNQVRVGTAMDEDPKLKRKKPDIASKKKIFCC